MGRASRLKRLLQFVAWFAATCFVLWMVISGVLYVLRHTHFEGL
jgi:hypothetical protein